MNSSVGMGIGEYLLVWAGICVKDWAVLMWGLYLGFVWYGECL